MICPLGPRVITSDWLVRSEKRVVRRSWRERLLSWPWRPWVVTRVEVVVVPDPQVYILPDGVLVAHPTTVRELLGELERVGLLEV